MIVFLSVDFDADSAERYYTPNSISKISKGKFGVNVGLKRLLSLFDRYGIRTTFFIPAWTVENYPESVSMILSEGHEIALHGYRHEKIDTLTFEEEREILDKSYRVLGALSDVYGFRKPYWEISKDTLPLLAKKGIVYDSSLDDRDYPYVMEVEKKRMVELPAADFLDDWLLFEVDRKSPEDVYSMWKSEYDAQLKMGKSYFPLVLHPSCIGRASRLLMLERLIKHIIDTGGIFKRGAEIAINMLEKGQEV